MQGILTFISALQEQNQIQARSTSWRPKSKVSPASGFLLEGELHQQASSALPSGCLAESEVSPACGFLLEGEPHSQASLAPPSGCQYFDLSTEDVCEDDSYVWTEPSSGQPVFQRFLTRYSNYILRSLTTRRQAGVPAPSEEQIRELLGPILFRLGRRQWGPGDEPRLREECNKLTAGLFELQVQDQIAMPFDVWHCGSFPMFPLCPFPADEDDYCDDSDHSSDLCNDSDTGSSS
jgi:hypothetical protein